ncbi:hypothetical protein [Mesorhizobium sp. WSM2239]|uniref:Uncharacterized protein n=2 Tax=unclassified Mesorhizobium TaxID=325217 RepID=A0AAU8DAR1_9HYPH
MAIGISSVTTIGISHAEEKYRLIHAIGTEEALIKADLTVEECQKLKSDLIEQNVIAVESGEEELNLGTLACLPESAFQ